MTDEQLDLAIQQLESVLALLKQTRAARQGRSYDPTKVYSRHRPIYAVWHYLSTNKPGGDTYGQIKKALIEGGMVGADVDVNYHKSIQANVKRGKLTVNGQNCAGQKIEFFKDTDVIRLDPSITAEDIRKWAWKVR
jgi:hypothetical protein